jgi:hypothetical protein
MPYPALPDRRMPYHRDGTRVGYRLTSTQAFTEGVQGFATQTQLQQLNDNALADVFSGDVVLKLWLFFPEQREVTACYADCIGIGLGGWNPVPMVMQGSNDTTNGNDGTWETASFPGGNPARLVNSGTWSSIDFDDWRKSIKPVSFTGPKRVVRTYYGGSAPVGLEDHFATFHLYGEKAAGQTPDDIVFVDDITDLEFQAPLDFGDRPLGTTVTRVFRLKNASTSKTANNINLQCNDSDFAISSNGTTWVTTLNFSSLAPGAETSNLYVRCTTPGPGAQLGPRFAEMVVTVGSWT